MKTLRFNMIHGVNQVQDKRLAVADTLPHYYKPDGMTPSGFVSHMENVDLRSGALGDVFMPKPFVNTLVPEIYNYVTGTYSQPSFVYTYRGKFYFSANRRDYAVNFVNSREVIYYTEYGRSPRKIVEGADVPLGTTPPLIPPRVSVGSPLTPQSITATQVNGGNITKGTVRSYRLAIQTPDGTLTASQTLTATASGDSGVSFQLNWSVPQVTNTKIIAIIIYAASNAIGQERQITTVGPAVNTFTDNGSVGSLGDLASNFDTDSEVIYIQTFTRTVNGVSDESGPSPLSPVSHSNSTRTLTFDLIGDGITSFEGYASWPTATSNLTPVYAGPWPPTAVTTTAVSCTQIATETATGKIQAFTSNVSALYNSENVLVQGTGTALDGQVVPIEIPHYEASDAVPTWIYLRPPKAYSIGNTVVNFTLTRVTTVDVIAWAFNPVAGMVQLTLSQAHTFSGGEWVEFANFKDPAWSGNAAFKQIQTSTVDPTIIFVANATVPSDVAAPASFWAIKSWVQVTGTLAANTGLFPPYDGDIVNFNYAPSTGANLVGSFVSRTGFFLRGDISQTPGGSPVFFVNAYFPSAPVTNPPAGTFNWVYRNGYIVSRNVYRIGTQLNALGPSGGTAEFRLVARLGLDITTYKDVIPDALLGNVLPTEYVTPNGTPVIFAPPPEDSTYITYHFGMMFAISQKGVVWTPVGQLDAWPPQFRQDFGFSPVALKPLDQALIVLCEDDLYRLDGSTPDSIGVSMTKTGYGCRAPYSVQKVGQGIIYLSDAGLMHFDGHKSNIITEMRMLPAVFQGSSYYVAEPPSPGAAVKDWSVNGPLIPTRQSFLYRNLVDNLGYDYDSTFPWFIRGTEAKPGINYDIRSFLRKGKYYMYWQQNSAEHQAQTMICIDLQAPGDPITVMSMKPQDVCMAENDRAFALFTMPNSTYWSRSDT